MIRETEGVGEQPGVAWYARTEMAGAWRIAACERHGGALQRHRFTHVGTQVEAHGQPARRSKFCEICRKPELLEEVEQCTCETDTARCPAHQNVGCGG